MSIYFDHPILLLLAVAAIPLIIIGWRSMSGLDVTRRVAALGFRALLVILLAVLLAAPHTTRQHHQLTVIGLLDISTSVRRFAQLPTSSDLSDRSNLEYLRQWFRNATDMKEPDDRFALIVFDGRAAAITTPSTESAIDDAFSITTVEGTNIADAIQLGLAMFPGDTARRLVLVSDGNQTAGDALEAVRRATGTLDENTQVVDADDQQLTIPIDVLPIAYNISNDVQIVRVEAPPQAQAGQTVTVRVVLEATQPTTGRLTLRHESAYLDLNGDEPGNQMRVDVPRGQSVQRVQVRLRDSKVNRFEAIFEPDDPTADALADNNAAQAFTATPAEGKVLIVDDGAGRRDNPLAQLLIEGDFKVELQTPIDFPNDLLSMQRYDLVILDNIPSYALTLDQQELLGRYVNDLGGGLMMLGGERSFGAGGWNGSTVEEILPLELDPPRELRLATAALVLVLDRSGSMNRPVAGARASQQEVANEGAALAVESLRETSYVGVVTFDLFAHEHVPLQRNDDPQAIAARIRAIRADGGTNLLPALQMAHRMLRNVDVEKKRVVCLSDGQSPTDGLAERVQRMSADGIQVTTIAVGDDADFATLANLADIGGGAFYEVRNPRVLPSVLIDSVQVLNKPLLKEGAFTPIVQPGATSLAAGMDAAPPLQGLVITAPKDAPAITIDLAHPDGEPLLAQWQAGLGRVAAFTSSIHAPWGDSWQGWPTAATFWTQLARRTSRPSMDQDTELRTQIEDDHMLVQLNVRSARTDESVNESTRSASTLNFLQVDGVVYRPDGSSERIRLRQTGPDQYSTSVPADAAGNYIVALTPRQAGQPLAPVIGGASRTGSAELRRYQSDIDLLREIAVLTGGRILEINDPLAVDMFDRSDLPKTRSILPVWRTVLLATLGLLLLDIANRRVSWSTAGLVAAGRRALRRNRSERIRAREIVTSVGSLRETGRFIRPAQSEQREHQLGSTADRLPPEVTFSIDRTAVQPQSEPEHREKAKTAEKQPPDRKAVEAALDQLLGRSSTQTSDADTPTGDSNAVDAAPDDAAARTNSLLEAKRRAQQRLREQDN